MSSVYLGETYSSLDISGPVSVKPIEQLADWEVKEEPSYRRQQKALTGYFILLLGPTGSGKSSFIESLSQDKSLRIAKDQLEGVTQDVQGYQVMNAQWANGENIYLIDTPGLLDRKITEARIFQLIYKWLRAKGVTQLHRVMYFDRITDIRMSGSRWKSISMVLKALSRFDERMDLDLPNMGVVHVTTMWDTLPSESHLLKAEARFQQILDTIDDWHALPQIPLYTGKFFNTAKSALQILDLETLSLIRGWRTWEPFSEVNQFSADDIYPNSGISRNQNFRLVLYQGLLDRISMTKQRLEVNRDFLEEVNVGDNKELLTLLHAEREDILEDLHEISVDLGDFGSPPIQDEYFQVYESARLRDFFSSTADPPASESTIKPFTPLAELYLQHIERTCNTEMKAAARQAGLSNDVPLLPLPDATDRVDAHLVSKHPALSRHVSLKRTMRSITVGISRIIDMRKLDARKGQE